MDAAPCAARTGGTPSWFPPQTLVGSGTPAPSRQGPTPGSTALKRPLLSPCRTVSTTAEPMRVTIIKYALHGHCTMPRCDHSHHPASHRSSHHPASQGPRPTLPLQAVTPAGAQPSRNHMPRIAHICGYPDTLTHSGLSVSMGPRRVWHQDHTTSWAHQVPIVLRHPRPPPRPTAATPTRCTHVAGAPCAPRGHLPWSRCCNGPPPLPLCTTGSGPQPQPR